MPFFVWLIIGTLILLVWLLFSKVTKYKKQLIVMKKDIEQANHFRSIIMDHLPIGIIFINTERKVVLYNDKITKIFPFTNSLDAFDINSASQFYEECYESPQVEVEVVMEILKQGKPISEEIYLKRNKVFIRNYIPLYLEGNLKGYLWFFEDITERKQMNSEFVFAKEEAIKASKAKTDFLSKMSHELRTPLNGVLGFSQLLELAQNLTHDQQVFVQEILKGGRHILHLINEVLDLSRIESGKVKVELDYINLSKLINECMNMLQPLADNKQINVLFENKQNGPLYVIGDPLRLKQILINLIENAIKYNVEKGKVIIVCRIAEGKIIISIQDTGIGIVKELQQKVFTPFYRINERQIQGTGIGLSIVKELVELMNGQVGVISEKEKGSEFWIQLPATNIVPDNSSQKVVEAGIQLTCMKESTVLYIEDNLSNIELVKNILQDVNNLKIKVAVTGEEGIKEALNGKIDLILLDIDLPDINGFEVLKIMKSIHATKDIPVVAISAFTLNDSIQELKERGFSDYIMKPFDIPSFYQVLGEYL